MQVEMPDVTGISAKEAKAILTEMEIEYEIDTEDLEQVITDQLPKKGIQINQGTKVYLYTN